ncbi:MAG: carboxypeptidase regulatory-like domain-containing protein [Candidatus Palauibacterales bacterium]|nr:carboxypeptidase regulatory-like domain-containing protein [Candidatus Palauibacterales bacterium]MDP2530813.1 carboxypeptidase regulatory-like domain-containing protein [Candidatus Palauibacterales bacterium]MDP2583113.1 carboxypeptidase regulatory-like domain-containing protein [Candidatus Palauibacterales bacterium]
MTDRAAARRPRFGLALSLLLVALSLPGGARAQGLVGRLVAAGDRAPIPGAMVRLLDPGEVERAWSLSGADGGFHVDSVPPGRYRIEVERIGFETWRSGVVEVPAAGVVRRTFRVPVRPVELGTIRVEGSSRGECRTRSEEGPALAAVWTEVRKALDRTRRTEQVEGDRFQLRRYDRFLDRDLRVVKEDVISGSKVGRATYRSVPVDTLVERGFASVVPGGGLDVHAPDAPVLLSDAFGATHCFRLVPGADPARGQVGLAFSPTRDRRVPEVEGTLWVDTATAHLRSLTFRYVHLGEPYPDSLAHGRLDYRALPGGEWVVDRWWIRLPSVVERRELAGRSPSADLLYGTKVAFEVATWQEFGGELVRALTHEHVAVAPHQGQIGGTVLDSAGGTPVPGATVRIGGTELVTRTDVRGRFLFPSVTPGRYRVVADDIGADTADAEATVEVAPDGVQVVELAGATDAGAADAGSRSGAPAAARSPASSQAAEALARRLRAASGVSVRDSAGAPASSSSGGTLIGTVRAADSGKPLEGAVLQVAGTDRTATSSASGHFRLDGLPGGAVRVTARYLGYASDTARLSLRRSALTVADFRLATQAIPLRELSVQVERSIRNAQVKGFYERMQEAAGGHFAGRPTIERYGLRGALERMPSVHITMCHQGKTGMIIVGCYRVSLGRAAGQQSLPFGGARCSPTFYADGHRVSTDAFVDIMMSLPPEATEGVEVHEASNVPPQYGGSGIGGCGVLMLWTRTLAGNGTTGADSARSDSAPAGG